MTGEAFLWNAFQKSCVGMEVNTLSPHLYIIFFFVFPNFPSEFPSPLRVCWRVFFIFFLIVFFSFYVPCVFWIYWFQFIGRVLTGYISSLPLSFWITVYDFFSDCSSSLSETLNKFHFHLTSVCCSWIISLFPTLNCRISWTIDFWGISVIRLIE